MARTRSQKFFRGLGGLLLLAFICFTPYLGGCALRSKNAVSVDTLGAGEPTAVKGEGLRVACWNIAHGRGGKLGASNWTNQSKAEHEAHLRQLGKQIAAENVDVVVLNEIDFDCTWSHRIDQAAFLARELGLPHLLRQRNYDARLPLRSWRFGNAVISRYPIDGGERIRFEPLSKSEAFFAGNHDAPLCRIVTPVGPVRLMAIHLEYREEPIRVQAAHEILEIANRSTEPLLALGDFNSTMAGLPLHNVGSEGASAIDLLLANGFTAGKGEHVFTFPAEAPAQKIDWILGYGLFPKSPIKVIPSLLSDHLMVVAEF